MPRILVVEDDPHVARVLLDLLHHHGYAADHAESGEQGLDRLTREDFDLVLLDVRLPGIDGFATCARMREVHGPSLPVIVMTAFGDAVAVRRGQEAGADDFLHKPIDTPALVLKVRAFLRYKALHDELLLSREQAQAQARDLAALYEIGRDWSLIAEPEEFNRTVTQRLAGLIGASICGIALYDAAARIMTAALPVHGLPDEAARRLVDAARPEHFAHFDFGTGEPQVSNDTRNDSRLAPEILEMGGLESIALVPLLSEGEVIGLLVAANKPGGFRDSDVQILSIFAGPAATFLRSRQIFDRARRHAARLERVASLVGEMAAVSGRARLLDLTVSRMRRDLGYDRVAFHAIEEGGGLREELGSGAPSRADPQLLRWGARSATPLRAGSDGAASELAVPVRAGEQPLGVLHVVRQGPLPLGDEEVSLLATLAGQLALALRRCDSEAATARMARQMATLYDLGLQTSPLRDLRLLFNRASAEAGRLIQADHTSVLRLDEREGLLRVYAAWAREPGRPQRSPDFRLGEGIAGRVARDRLPALVNDVMGHVDFVPRGHPVARILCVPLTYFDQEREAPSVFGVLNATRRPGSAPFTNDDLGYLTRFAGQLSIAVANAMAFDAERERSEQIALVNALLGEMTGVLSRERILERAVRRIHQAFRYPMVAIVEPDLPAGLWRLAAAATRGPLPEGWPGYPLAAGIAGRAWRARRTVVIPDLAKEEASVASQPTVRSQAAVPIASGEDVVAIMMVESEFVRGFDRGHIMTLETLADGIGIILRNAELYQALEDTNARLVELDRMKSELLHIVAHDFRAPLSGILGHAELLEWKPDREDRVERSRAIVRAATHMANLMDKTLVTTRLETGQFPFEFALVDLVAQVKETVARLPPSPAHPLKVELPDHPLPCWADGDRLGEVVENLLSNAVKYSPEGGEVHLEVRRAGETAEVRVSDQGMGIEAGDLDRLFRPFSRVRNKSTVGIQGFGLGLSICERIVRAHGGRLSVESVPGRGSTFCFAVPRFGAAAQVRAPLVLVAARDQGTRREVRRVAEELGYGIHEVADGVEAVEAAVRLLPSAVILDRILPRLGAEEVASRLRENQATESLPIFALAAAEDLGEKAALFRACVPKPLDRGALAAALEELARPVA